VYIFSQAAKTYVNVNINRNKNNMNIIELPNGGHSSPLPQVPVGGWMINPLL
jgi:predicted porin